MWLIQVSGMYRVSQIENLLTKWSRILLSHWWKLLGETKLSRKEFNQGSVEGSLSKGVSSNSGLQEPVEKTERKGACVPACYVASVVANSGTLWTTARQAALSMWFPRQQNWSGSPCPPPVDSPNPGMEPMSLTSTAMAGRFFTARTTWEAQMKRCCGPSPSWEQHVTPGLDLRGTDWPTRAEVGWHSITAITHVSHTNIFKNVVCAAESLTHVWLFVTPWTVAH